MKCPVCKLENPANALQCDCGHQFAAAYTKSSYMPEIRADMADPSISGHLRSIDRSLRTIKIVVVAWAVLTFAGFVLSVVVGRLKL
jgi:hypothetical protein